MLGVAARADDQRSILRIVLHRRPSAVGGLSVTSHLVESIAAHEAMLLLHAARVGMSEAGRDGDHPAGLRSTSFAASGRSTGPGERLVAERRGAVRAIGAYARDESVGIVRPETRQGTTAARNANEHGNPFQRLADFYPYRSFRSSVNQIFATRAILLRRSPLRAIRGKLAHVKHPLVASALLLIATLSGADEDARSAWTALAPGLWHRPWAIRGANGNAAEGHAFRADPALVKITALDARKNGRDMATAEALRTESAALLVVNGGFFDENSRPLGLVVGEGRERSPLRLVDQGVFLIADGKPSIQHSRDALPLRIETALQCGPRLVVSGRPLRLKPQISRRTSVCLPGDGTVVVVVFPTGISLSSLARELAATPAKGGLGCWAALNLDGGPSTQLSVATPAMNLEVPGGWPVPNGLAVLPR